MHMQGSHQNMRACEDGACGCATRGGKRADWAMIPLRLAVALIFIVHGYGKLTGQGLGPGMEAFTGLLTNLHVPQPQFMTWVVALVEFGGGIAVLMGLFTRVAAALLAVTMAVAYWLVKSKMPFTAGEIDIALFAISAALVGLGAGRCSLDGWWKYRRESRVSRVDKAKGQNP